MSLLILDQTINKVKLLPLVEPSTFLRRVKVKVKNDWHQSNKIQKRLLVNHDYRFIYCPIHKVASSSMMAALLALSDSKKKEKLLKGDRLNIRLYIELNYSLASYPYAEAKQFINSDYFKFAIVRNPWARLVSTYANFFVTLLSNGEPTDFSKRLTCLFHGEENYETYKDQITFRQFLVDYVYPTKDEDLNLHCAPQSLFLGDIKYDFIGRQENLTVDLQYIKDRLNLPLELPKLNSTKYVEKSQNNQNFADFSSQELRSLSGKFPKYQQFYTPELIELVRQRYKQDIELVSYEFE